MVVIGGMGSMTGAVLGAVYVRSTQYFLPAQFQLLVTGFGMLVLLLFFPGGLGQIVFRSATSTCAASRQGGCLCQASSPTSARGRAGAARTRTATTGLVGQPGVIA